MHRPLGLPRLAALLLLLGLAACGRSELHTRLSETQANEMVAVLRIAGIEARKEPGGEAGWRVTAPDGDFARAVEALRAAGYPRDEHASLGDIFRKDGFVSSAVEERARLRFGLQQELAATLSGLDGVTRARVHIDLAEQNPMADRQRPSTASVVLFHVPGANVEKHRGQIRSLVVNSVAGLPPENVSIQIFPQQPLPAAAPAPVFRSTVASFGTMALLLLAAIAGAMAMPGMGARMRRRANPQRADTASGERT